MLPLLPLPSRLVFLWLCKGGREFVHSTSHHTHQTAVMRPPSTLPLPMPVSLCLSTLSTKLTQDRAHNTALPGIIAEQYAVYNATSPTAATTLSSSHTHPAALSGQSALMMRRLIISAREAVVMSMATVSYFAISCFPIAWLRVSLSAVLTSQLLSQLHVFSLSVAHWMLTTGQLPAQLCILPQQLLFSTHVAPYEYTV